MTLRSSMGLGRYAASEKDLFVATPTGWAGGIRGVLFFHGATGTGPGCVDYTVPGTMRLLNAIAERFPVLSIDAGGPQAWGNTTARARAADGRTYLQGTWGAKSGPVLCVGESMGALLAMNYAKANPTHVAAVVGVIPVCDLNDVVSNNRGGAAANINTAYGGTYSEGTHGPTGNPANYAASYATPTRLFYASDDTTVISSTVTAFAAAAQSVTASSLGALGHTEAAVDAVPRPTVLDFLSQYA